MIKEIKLTEKDRKLLKPDTERISNAEFGYDVAVQRLRNGHDTLWKRLLMLYPEVAKHGKSANFNTKTNSIVYDDIDERETP